MDVSALTDKLASATAELTAQSQLVSDLTTQKDRTAAELAIANTELVRLQATIETERRITAGASTHVAVELAAALAQVAARRLDAKHMHEELATVQHTLSDVTAELATTRGALVVCEARLVEQGERAAADLAEQKDQVRDLAVVVFMSSVA